MKLNNKLLLILLVLVLIFSQTACKKDSNGSEGSGTSKDVGLVDESWAYNHDKTKEVLRLYPDGTAMYLVKVFENGKQVQKETRYVSYTKGDSFITLKDKDGNELKLRYTDTDEGMFLYEKSDYKNAVKTEGNGVTGVWVNKDFSDYFFEFSDKGTFLEDGYFSGKYTLDEKAGTILLNYGAMAQESLLYYSIEGDTMTIEYPWPMVLTEKA